jgi:ParB/RepB/Spo0J family partition protein
MEVALTKIYPNPDQPRKVFDKDALQELAASIKELGLIEPIVVVERQAGPGRYMIVAGERRWRACTLAGLTSAPVRIVEADGPQIAEMALAENVQREDLLPLEEARAYQALLDNGHTIHSLSQKMGIHPWKITLRTNLLRLDPKFQEAVKCEVITAPEAYEMSRMEEPADQEMIYQKIRNGAIKGQVQARRFVNALIDERRQSPLFDMPAPEKQAEVVNRWEKSLEAVSRLVGTSFSSRDCEILAKVYKGDTELNITKIDLVIGHLNMVKAAMLDNLSSRQARAAIMAEG